MNSSIFTPYKNITKELAKELLKAKNKKFEMRFISGSNLHPNPKLYKYYWWIYSLESKEQSAADVFYKDEYRLTTKEFMSEFNRLKDKKISFAYVNTKYHRLGSIFDYEKLKKEFPDIEFALSFEEDNDEMDDKGYR